MSYSKCEKCNSEICSLDWGKGICPVCKNTGVKPKREGMTDRDILEQYKNDFCHCITNNLSDDKLIDKALKDLRAYYQEKIKKVDMEKVLDKTILAKSVSHKWVRHSKNPFGIVTYLKALELSANAILKEIDKEMR